MNGENQPSLMGVIGLRDFPKLPASTVERPHLLDTLREMLVQDAPVVFLEASEGMGATTLCAQFAEANARNTFCLFVKPASKLAYNPDYLRLLLAEQFVPWLTGKVLAQSTIDPSEFSSILLKVRRRAKLRPIYFVVDGLHQIPSEDARFVEQIFHDVLPIGIEPFRFIVTGHAETLKKHIRNTRHKTFQVIKFTAAESESLLAGLCDDPDDRSQLERLCQGIPGRLASVQRVLQSGQSPKEILELDPTKTLEFVRLEFSNLAALSEPDRTLVAVLTFGRQTLAVPDLSKVVERPESQVTAVIEQCLFLDVNRQTGAIEFRSEGHRKYAENKLESLRTKALTLQIEALRSDPSGSAALRLLPNYYQQLNNQRAIVELLSPEHYQRLLQVTQSVSALKLRAALGARSATVLNEAKSIFQFSLQRSIFSSVSELGGGAAQVAALVALGQSQRALDMAAAATAKELRLGLLAAYARMVIEQGGAVDDQTIGYIRETAGEIDFSGLGERAAEIAADLVFVDQDLAFAIVDASTKAASSAREKDAAYARLSVAALLSDVKDTAGIGEKARQRIGDSELHKMLSSLTMIAAKFSFDDIVIAAEKMEIERRIYFLRTLVSAGRNRPGVLNVVEYALDQIVGDAGYSPKTKDFCDLAEPLPYATESLERAVRIARRIEGQLGLVGKLATSKEFVQLQMRLAHVEVAFGIGSAGDRVAEAYYDVISSGNLEAKVDCLAIMLRALLIFDKDDVLEKVDGFKAVITNDLSMGLDLLLQGTADQFEVVKGALRALTHAEPLSAFALVSRLNTANRRDQGYREIVQSLVSAPFSDERREDMERALGKIRTDGIRDSAIRETFRSIERKESSRPWLNALLKFEILIVDPETASECLIDALGLLAEAPGEILKEIRTRLMQHLGSLSSAQSASNLRFLAASKLARHDRLAAIALYEDAVRERSVLSLESDDALEILLHCLSLVVRVYRPLAKVDLLEEDQIVRLSRLVEFVPDILTRSKIYCDLVCRVWCEGRVELANNLVTRFCQPLLEQVESEGGFLEERLIDILFPALFATRRSLACRLIERIPVNDQSVAYWSVARMVARKVSPFEPSQRQDDVVSPISYSDAVELVEILGKISSDVAFYVVLSSLVKSLDTRESRQRVTGTQKNDLASSLKNLIHQKLPDPENITHEGYVIVSEAQVLRLLEARGQEWDQLVIRAGDVPNISDKAFVLLEIAECLPARRGPLRKVLINDALTAIEQIPSAYDRFGRLEHYTQVVKKYDLSAAKCALRQAMQLTFDIEQRDQAAQFRRNLVDLADSLETGYAEKVAEMIDDDPARRAAKVEMRRLGEVQKLRRQISMAKNLDKNAPIDSKNLPSAAWKNVTALVSGRMVAQSPASMANYVNSCGGSSLSDAFPVLCWYVENAGRKFATQEAAAQNISPLAEVLLASTEIGVSVIRQIQAKGGGVSDAIPTDDNGITVGPNDRSQGMEYIRAWLRVHASGDLVLCDPYFGLGDLDFLKLVLAEAPNSRLRIITTGDVGRLEAESLSVEWRRLSDQEPPETEIISVLGESGKGVLHDRWIISGGSGLRLGTSLNSLGRGKLSEISVLEASRVTSVSSQLDPYLRRARVVENARFRYSIVMI